MNKHWIFQLMVGFFFFTGILSCSEEDPSSDQFDYLIFGTFYGECIGEECIEIFRIEDGKLFEDLDDRYPDGGSQESGNYMELSEEKYQEVKNLYDTIPELLWALTDGTIGCPDCTDGGGVYVEIQRGDENKFWVLDNFLNRIPEPYHEIVNTIHDSVNKIQ